jgi:hypothetical protein
MKYRENESEPWKELYIKALDSMPIGSIIGFVGTDIPNGWLICDGSTLDEETYPELYDALGGSGSTFTLPDCKGRVLVGYDANDTDFNAIGKTGGSKELQEHSHTVNMGTPGGGYGGVQSGYFQDRAVFSNIQSDTTQAGTGNSGNLQPYYVAYKIIKAKNTTPTMASIVNAKNNSTTDGYSCDYVNKLHTYSTTEQRVGTWINGKPVYRKVIESELTGTGQKNIAHNISNIDNVISVTGTIRIGTTKEWFLSPMSAPTDAVPNYGISIQSINDTNIIYFIGAQMGGNTKYAKTIIEYTKTTD